MKINGNEIRPGMTLEHKGQLWRVAKISHTQPGKGGAYTQAEMKDIINGTKLNERFRSDEKVERARLEQRPMQYLFSDGTTYTFMDMTTYDQVELSPEVIGEEQLVWLVENMEVSVEFHNNSPIGAELPATVIATVAETEAVVKGQTAANSYKPATLDNGASVMVPPFVEAGTKIKVNTADSTYMERA